MKLLFLIALLSISAALHAQKNYKKLSTLGIHYSLTDFESSAKIQAASFADVVKNKQWSHPPQMMTGIGFDYIKGITDHIDFAASFNYTKGINNYKLPVINTIPYTLLTLDALVNIKLLSDKYYVRPYLLAGAGVYDQNGFGFYAPAGGGFQFNLFDAALVNIQAQFRSPFAMKDYGNFYYQFGMATALGKRKPKTIAVVPPQPEIKQAPKQDSVKQEVKIIFKDIAVTVNDEATGLPLQYASVIVSANDGASYNGITNAEGKVIFNHVQQGSYTVSAKLNNIDASSAALTNESFEIASNALPVMLTHNDPRFTLAGYVVDKKSGAGIGNTTIAIKNTTQGSTAVATSNATSGGFLAQLESNSSFVISGKKENYISNIENISTQGLNRSTTLYVKLELIIEEAKAGESIVLNKIYFETGKSILNTTASTDLNKLVQFLKDNPATKLEIQGYTDNTGSLATNNLLSQKRANSVVDFLTKNGIEKSRLTAKGYGPLKPVATNATIEGRAQNRRVEIMVLK